MRRRRRGLVFLVVFAPLAPLFFGGRRGGVHALAARRTASSQRLALFVDDEDEDGALVAASYDGAPLQVRVAAKQGRLAPKVRFARAVLGCAEPAALFEACPRLVSTPLTAVLAPRHAFLELTGARSGAALTPAEVDRVLCRGAGDDEGFVEGARELGGQNGSVADYQSLRLAFRRGARDAARRGDAASLRAFARHGWCAATDRDRRGASALHWAAGHGETAACAALVEHAGLAVKDTDTDRSTPLHWACVGVSGNAFGVGACLETMRWLLDRGADSNAPTAGANNTCVHWAAWAGGPAALDLLAAHGGGDLGAMNANGCHAAHWAAAGGAVETLDYLAARCPHEDLRRPNRAGCLAGHTPLEHAVAHGRLRAAEWFIDRGIVDVLAVEYAARLAALSDDGRRAAIATSLQAPSVVPDL